MGFLSWLRLTDSAAALTATAGAQPIPSGATSAELPADVAIAFGLSPDTVSITRREAMTVPAVKRGRNVIAGTIGTLPLVVSRAGSGGTGPAGDAEVVDRPLIEQPDPNTTRASTITWTVDDLIFHGVAMWLVTARAGDRFPAAAERLARERWHVAEYQGRRRVFVDGSTIPTDDADLIRFDGPDEGALITGARTLRTALRLEDAVHNFARLDIPLGSIEPAEGAEALTDEEIDELLDGWEKSRRERSTAYLQNSRYVAHQMDARSLQIDEARKTQDGKVAQLLNLDARYVNAPTGDSLTYATTEGNRRDLVDLSLAPYLAAIDGRLSLRDVTPRGQLVRFDLSSFLRGDLAGVITAVGAGLADVAEGRHWLGLRPRSDLPPAPAGKAPTTEVPA